MIHVGEALSMVLDEVERRYLVSDGLGIK